LKQVDIVIVNWNSGDQLRECLASIAHIASAETLGRVVVVDNASSDNSMDNVEQINLPLSMIRNSENRGFAAACNMGANVGRAEFILFLNPDTQLKPNSLSAPLLFMSDPIRADVGICGIQLFDKHGCLSRTCDRFPSAAIMLSQLLGLNHLLPKWFPGLHMTDWDHSTTQQVEHVIGAFFFVQRMTFEKLDGFDERFFVYFEDLDFSFRAHKAGWRSIYLVDAQAYHRGCGTTDQAKARRLYYSLRSRILYAAKHFSKIGAMTVTAATLLLEPFTRLAWFLLHVSPCEMWETIRGYSCLWANLPRILFKGRRQEIDR
jgi:N-acetylglucosaminyl-diphospho-decaprenol L-rhamnosyltransferase